METGVLNYYRMKSHLLLVTFILLTGAVLYYSCKRELSCESCADAKKINHPLQRQELIRLLLYHPTAFYLMAVHLLIPMERSSLTNGIRFPGLHQPLF